MTELWAQEAAEAFWSAAGGPPAGWPRDLRRPIAFSLPLFVVDIPRPRVASVNQWLEQRGVAPMGRLHDRLLRACLVVRGDDGFIFLDGADPDDERRFSLAHEVAHFWLEHQAPRQRVVHKLGPTALDALEGMRAPTETERVRAALAGIPFTESIHLMERDPAGQPTNAAISAAERRADALALELLAPADAVRTEMPARASAPDVASLLSATFGLPAPVAGDYARAFAPSEESRSNLIKHLRIVSNSDSGVRNPR